MYFWSQNPSSGLHYLGSGSWWRFHHMYDENCVRRKPDVMAVAQAKLEKEVEDCSLLPLVHDIIKW